VINIRRYSSVSDDHFLKKIDCETHCCLMLEKVGRRLSVNKYKTSV
jgi:hypothetical protein